MSVPLRRPTTAALDLRADSDRKYPDSTLLAGSAGRGWSTLYAELRAHPAGTIRSAVQDNIEVLVTLSGTRHGLVHRAGAGRQQQTRATAGTIWLVPSGVGTEEIVVTAPIPKILHLYLPARQIELLAEQYDLPKAPTRAIQYLGGLQDALIHQLGLAVQTELDRETATTRMFVETAALMLAARLAQRYSDADARADAGPIRKRLDGARLRRVLDHIDQHLEEEITVADLAGAAALSAFHFTRLFTAAMGMPPYRYVGRRRLDRAMALLAQGELPLSEIAYRCRFSSPASFHRAFRRATGMTPGAYRRLAC